VSQPGVALRGERGEREAACRGRISTVEVSRRWRFVDELPMTVTAKVRKFRLREPAAAALERLGDAATVSSA